MTTLLSWILFNVFVAAAMALDLSLFKQGCETLRIRQAVVRSALWIILAGTFAVIVYATQGQVAALEFSTGYVIELSLSVDNLFIFLLIFRYFRLPEAKQLRVLFWGIL
ncbi:MAG: TerC family protein, partial [Acidobacteria bacterium]|nr:TerC family protein [Acidobacteriota bacterium]